MAYCREDTNELFLKIIYVGASGSGKTTNFRALYHHAHTGGFYWGQKHLAATRNLSPFDFLPLKLGTIRGYEIIIHLFSLPPVGFWPVTEKTLLREADGCVFVCDSRSTHFKKTANFLESLETLNQFSELLSLPKVYQWNFKDSQRSLPSNALQNAFNPNNAPSIDSIAIKGLGVLETLNTAVQNILKNMESKQTDIYENAATKKLHPLGFMSGHPAI